MTPPVLVARTESVHHHSVRFLFYMKSTVKTAAQLDSEFRRKEFLKRVQYLSERFRVALVPYIDVSPIGILPKIRMVDMDTLASAAAMGNGNIITPNDAAAPDIPPGDVFPATGETPATTDVSLNETNETDNAGEVPEDINAEPT